ncbi:protein of unknown function [Cupriavidus taiwanensis]|uniref:Uncharacterized protein n=1 Tax=Cupriavidus taiwanensis TaxID=164546 RepID=A0A9Q7UPE9_9BURK|nr:protein of unknown function [Cupriavidus taiwanensis]
MGIGADRDSVSDSPATDQQTATVRLDTSVSEFEKLVQKLNG